MTMVKMIVGFRYSQNRCSQVRVLPIVIFFSVNLNLYIQEQEPESSILVTCQVITKVSCHWHFNNIINLLTPELFCSYSPGNYDCTTEHLF